MGTIAIDGKYINTGYISPVSSAQDAYAQFVGKMSEKESNFAGMLEAAVQPELITGTTARAGKTELVDARNFAPLFDKTNLQIYNRLSPAID